MRVPVLPARVLISHDIFDIVKRMDTKTLVTILITILVLGVGFYAGSRYQAGRLITDSDVSVLKPIDDGAVVNTPSPSAPPNTPAPVDELPKVTSFEECVAAGNPVMESYPRQCNDPVGGHFVEDIETDTIPTTGTLCKESQRNVDACIQVYQPVCGLVQVECITTPCDPVPQTFSNSCFACRDQRTISYTEGECSL